MHVLRDRINTDRISVVCFKCVHEYELKIMELYIYFLFFSTGLHFTNKLKIYLFILSLTARNLYILSSHYIVGSIVSQYIPQTTCSIPVFFLAILAPQRVHRFQPEDESIEGIQIYRQIIFFSQVNVFA